MPKRVKEVIRIGLGRVRVPAGARNIKKTLLKLIFNNLRSSIKPESAPNSNILSNSI